MGTYHNATVSQQPPRKVSSTPYDALSVFLPNVQVLRGKKCVTSRRRTMRYPHLRRVELAAGEYRAETRLRILNQVRLHPFARAFSERRMAVEGFSTRKSFCSGIWRAAASFGGT